MDNKRSSSWTGGATARLLVCSAFYQAVWFGVVLTASRPAMVVLGPLLVLLGGTIQMLLWPALRGRALRLAGAALLVGLVVDTVLTASGVLVPQRHWLPYPVTPVWLLSLWAGFGIYIALGLERMYGRLRLAALAGLAGGPLAYRGGVPFGALDVGEPAWAMLLLVGAVWAGVFSLLVWLAGRAAPISPRNATSGVASGPAGGRAGKTVAILAILSVFTGGDLWALRGDETRFSPEKSLGGVELKLRGVGRLRRFMITGCDIALYTHPATTRQTLLDGAPVALEFVYYTSIKGRQFAHAAEKTLGKNISPEAYVRFRDMIERMGRMFTDVKPGDRYLLSFVPGDGLALDLNGKRQGVIPSDAFACVYLRIWLGENPIDQRLLEGMLGNMPEGAE